MGMTKETIQKCIDLLNTDGINSKEQVKKILQGELETIDNAEPSEALEKLSKSMPQYDSWIKYIDTIKQALLKTEKEHKALDKIIEIHDKWVSYISMGGDYAMGLINEVLNNE